jgi:CelD/BcsL family acetyltransferase involved in cellulose biosynthesis
VKITSIPARTLTDDLISRWAIFQGEDVDLASPCFCPEFMQAIAAVREDLEIGLLEDDGEVGGFFPFVRSKAGVGYLPGICDYQGIIAKKGMSLDARQLLRGCGLVAWDFDHLLASQTVFQQFHRGRGESPIMDLSGGYEAYVMDRRAAGTEQIKKAANLTRRLEREVAPLRFDSNVVDEKLLFQLITWADSKYGRTAAGEPTWTYRVLERILATQKKNFRGMLSVLYAGDEVAAAHFGMRSHTIWHYWWPAYNPRFEKYSPGIILLLKMAEVAASIGISTIDLGKGRQPYKERLMNGVVPLAHGFVEVPSLRTACRMLSRSAKASLQKLPGFYATLRRGYYALRRIGKSSQPG